jgi:hypothetical protein
MPIPSMPRPVLPVDALLNRIKAEYIDLPGLRLTRWQAQRLWGLEAMQCDALLGALVDSAFLSRTAEGTYVRLRGTL